MKNKQRSRRESPHRLPEELFALRDRYVRAAGRPESVAVESETDDEKNDHVWISIRAGEFGPLQIALSTTSRKSHAAGFDPRVRLGIVTSTWAELPAAGLEPSDGLDYARLEAGPGVDYVALERAALEELLIAKARRAIFIEVWGQFYVRAHIGVHEIHSRRASSAVPRDLIGQDGAVRFYFAGPNENEMLLFKFAGQP